MKKILIPAIALLVLVVVAIVAAKYARSSNSAHILSGTIISEGVMKHTEEAQYYTIEASYPTETPLYNRWNTKADTTARDTMETFLLNDTTQFKQDLDVDHISGPEKESLDSTGRKYAYDATFKPYAASNGKLISYEYDMYIDTGGAHPNGYFHTFVFDTAGKEVKLGDLFKPNSDYLERIASSTMADITRQLSERMGLPTQAGEDASSDIFADGLAPKEENFSDFVIDGDSIVFLIPPYQAAAYAAGNFEVRIPLSQFADILNPAWK